MARRIAADGNLAAKSSATGGGEGDFKGKRAECWDDADATRKLIAGGHTDQVHRERPATRVGNGEMPRDGLTFRSAAKVNGIRLLVTNRRRAGVRPGEHGDRRLRSR